MCLHLLIYMPIHFTHQISFTLVIWGGWVRQRCRVSYVTVASTWYWLTVGIVAILQQVRQSCRVSCITVVSTWYWLTVGQGLLFCKAKLSCTAGRVSYVTVVSTWYWLTIGQGLLFCSSKAKLSCILRHCGGLQLGKDCFFAQLRSVEGNVFNSPVSSLSFIFLCPLSFFYYLFYLSSPFWRPHKMTHKGWHVIKPQLNQFTFIIY